MQLSEAFDSISVEYAPGTAKFFDGMPNNPWQAVHDRLEGQMLLFIGNDDYFEKIRAPIEQFHRDIKKLIEMFKTLNPVPQMPSMRDALMIGNENRLAFLNSLAENSCLICETKENVRIAVHEQNGAGLFCNSCVQEKVKQ